MYNIRSVTLQDIDAIHLLMTKSVFEFCKDYYSKAELEAYLSSFTNRIYYNELLSDKILIVACIEEIIVGFAQYNPSVSAIDAIYVLPGHTGKGVGTRLLGYIEDIARSLKKEEINIAASKNAISFYEKSQYTFLNTGYITCKDGTKFESVEFSKNIAN